jgi:Predicted transcriptional regulators
MEREEFTARLVKLRMNKGVSARDMSLSLGQSENYINEIENGKAYPSMQAFFYICDYFNITPQEFFDTGRPDPNGSNFLIQRLKGLSPEKLRIISTMIDSWDK